ncbi:acyl carrier protein [Actinokineospora sp. 24-640]
MTAILPDTQVHTAIVAALSEVVGAELTGVTAETRLFDDLNLDSTSVLGLLMALEDSLDIQVEPENLEQRHLETVGALAEFLAESR